MTDYLETIRLKNNQIRQHVSDFLLEHPQLDGPVSPHNQFPQLPVLSVAELTGMAAFRAGMRAAEIGVRRSILTKHLPIEVQDKLSGHGFINFTEVWFVPTEVTATAIVHHGHDITAVVRDIYTLTHVRLGCAHPDFVSTRITPTLTRYECVTCPLVYDVDTGD